MARNSLYPPSVDAGFPVLPPTPEGWSRITFGDAVEVVERPKALLPDESYQLVTAKRSRGGIVSRGNLLGREVLTKTQFEVRAGDFLISRRQIIHGACGVVPEDLDGAVVSGEYSALHTRSPLVMEFLAHYCHTPYFQRTCFHSSHGVDVEKMIFKINEWLEREVDLPPVSEQRKIAAILASVDDAIAATQAVIDQLGSVKKAMMADLLARGLPGRRTRFKQTESTDVPNGWQVATLGQVADVAYGLTVNAERRASTTTRPYLTVANAQEDGFDLTTVKEIGVLPGDVSRYELQTGDMLIIEGNANPERLGRAFVWRNELPGALHQNHLIRARVVDQCVKSQWLAICVNGEAVRQQIRDQAKTSSGLHTINSRVVADLRVPIPPVAEQRIIVEAYLSVDARIGEERNLAARLKQVKSALSAALLTGDLRVTPDPEPPA